jgi:hypothetical protein
LGISPCGGAAKALAAKAIADMAMKWRGEKVVLIFSIPCQIEEKARGGLPPLSSAAIFGRAALQMISRAGKMVANCFIIRKRFAGGIE